MSLYAIRNDEGLLMDDLGQFEHNRDICAFHSKSDAKDWADNKRGHVVELAEKPAPVVVSAEEDKVLKKAKDTTVWRPAAVISKYAYNAVKDSNQEVLLEDRLMRAYVIGWTIDKPKRFVLPMEETKKPLYAWKKNGHWDVAVFYGEYISDDPIVVTQSDLDAAPAWVKAITPVEVRDEAD